MSHVVVYQRVTKYDDGEKVDAGRSLQGIS